MSKKVFHFKHTINTDFNWDPNIVYKDSPYNGWTLGVAQYGERFRSYCSLIGDYFIRVDEELNKITDKLENFFISTNLGFSTVNKRKFIPPYDPYPEGDTRVHPQTVLTPLSKTRVENRGWGGSLDGNTLSTSTGSIFYVLQLQFEKALNQNIYLSFIICNFGPARISKDYITGNSYDNFDHNDFGSHSNNVVFSVFPFFTSELITNFEQINTFNQYWVGPSDYSTRSGGGKYLPASKFLFKNFSFYYANFLVDDTGNQNTDRYTNNSSFYRRMGLFCASPGRYGREFISGVLGTHSKEMIIEFDIIQTDNLIRLFCNRKCTFPDGNSEAYLHDNYEIEFSYIKTLNDKYIFTVNGNSKIDFENNLLNSSILQTKADNTIVAFYLGDNAYSLCYYPKDDSISAYFAGNTIAPVFYNTTIDDEDRIYLFQAYPVKIYGGKGEYDLSLPLYGYYFCAAPYGYEPKDNHIEVPVKDGDNTIIKKYEVVANQNLSDYRLFVIREEGE